MSHPFRRRELAERPMLRIWTIGHSRHSLAQLLALLRAHGVAAIADIRRYPFSRRHPHVSKPALSRALAAVGMVYEHFPALGGRREPIPGLSTNAAIGDPALRGYADWAGSAEFQAGLVALCALASRQPTAVLCAEADPARCHRALLADQLVARGVEVRHILADGKLSAHALPATARVLPDGRVVYPLPQLPLWD